MAARAVLSADAGLLVDILLIDLLPMSDRTIGESNFVTLLRSSSSSFINIVGLHCPIKCFGQCLAITLGLRLAITLTRELILIIIITNVIAIKRHFIFPPYLITASALLGDMKKDKIASFHSNAVCTVGWPDFNQLLA